jgi:hypothetical protein
VPPRACSRRVASAVCPCTGPGSRRDPRTVPYYGSPGLLPKAIVSRSGARVCDGS